MGLILVPGSKQRLQNMLLHLLELVEGDAERDIICFRATELTHHAVSLSHYAAPEQIKKIDKKIMKALVFAKKKRNKKRPLNALGINDGIIRGHDW